MRNNDKDFSRAFTYWIAVLCLITYAVCGWRIAEAM